MTGVGDVHRVLREDHRVVVREGHTPASAGLRGLRDLFRRRLVHQAIHVTRLADVPVLAELAGQVAAGSAERQDAGARVELVQRLLLDRIDAEPGRPPVGRQHHAVVDPLAHEAGAALALVQPAIARAQVALDAAVLERVPVARRVCRGRGVAVARVHAMATTSRARPTWLPCSGTGARRRPRNRRTVRPSASGAQRRCADRAIAPTPAAGTCRACRRTRG